VLLVLIFDGCVVGRPRIVIVCGELAAEGSRSRHYLAGGHGEALALVGVRVFFVGLLRCQLLSPLDFDLLLGLLGSQHRNGLALLLRRVKRLQNRRHFHGVRAFLLVASVVGVLINVDLDTRAIPELLLLVARLDVLAGHDARDLLVVVQDRKTGQFVLLGKEQFVVVDLGLELVACGVQSGPRGSLRNASLVRVHTVVMDVGLFEVGACDEARLCVH